MPTSSTAARSRLPSQIVTRPTILRIRPRHYRVVDSRFVPVGQDYRGGALALIAISIALFLFLDIDLAADPLVPAAIICIGVVGLAILVRAPLRLLRTLLLDVDLSRGTVIAPTRTTNGSGAGEIELAVSEVDELLFAMRDVPVDTPIPKHVTVHGFAVYIRTFDGDLVPVVESCLDHDRSFRVAKFLSEAFDVGIKQVGKGWRSA